MISLKNHILYCFGLALLAAFANANAGELFSPSDKTRELADLLPPNSIACIQHSCPIGEEGEYKGTVLKLIAQQPGVAKFIEQSKLSRTKLVNTIASEANVSPEFISSLFEAQFSAALLDVAVDPETGIDFSAVLALTLSEVPDQETVFRSVAAAIREYQKASGDETPKNLTLVSKEAKIGQHEVLRVIAHKPIRVVILGKSILVYNSTRREFLEEIVGNYDNRLTAKSLARTQVYKNAKAGTESTDNMGFAFINARRMLSLMGALGKPEYTRLLDALGISGVQAIGLAGGFYKAGIRHTMYLYAPQERHGILEAFTMKGKAEFAAGNLPGDTNSMMAARLNLATLYRKIPILVDSVENALSHKAPIGLSSLAGQQTLLGAPAVEVLSPLGDAMIVEPGPSGNVIRFDLVNIKAFEAVIAKMEQTLGRKLSTLNVETSDKEQMQVHYFNRSGTPLPFAPSYCVSSRKDDGTAVVYIASSPQAITAVLLRQKTDKTLAQSLDYRYVLDGMGRGYGVFAYINTRKNMQSIYDWAVPVMNAFTAYPGFSADPGVLPPGSEVVKYLFGTGLGIKSDEQGIAFTVYSPIGLGGLLAYVLDTPLVHGMLAAEAARLLGNSEDALADDAVTSEPAPGSGNRIPGIGGR